MLVTIKSGYVLLLVRQQVNTWNNGNTLRPRQNGNQFPDDIFEYIFLNENIYSKISNIRRTLVGNKFVDQSDVVGASPVGAAPTTSSFSTQHLASRYSAKAATRQYENLLSVGIWCVLYQRLDGKLRLRFRWGLFPSV